MNKTMLYLSFGWLCLAAPVLRAATPRSQSDSMKQDSMKQGSMSQDSMAHDKMMAKPAVIKGWVSDSECAAEGRLAVGSTLGAA